MINWKQSIPGGRHDRCKGPDPRMNLAFDGLKDDQNWNMVGRGQIRQDLVGCGKGFGFCFTCSGKSFPTLYASYC